jgi:alpha(1,3/1,4) fucosyltransferase
MTIKVASVYADGHSKNSLFAQNDPTNTYAPTFTSRLLKEALLAHNIELNTADLNEGKELAFELYIEGQAIRPMTVPKYLVASENPHINPLNCDVEYCSQFKKVFSWNPHIASLPNGILVMVPNELIVKTTPAFHERPLLVALINANKRFPKELDGDLYEERIKLIRWYEMHQPKSFGLFGRGWDKPSPAFTFAEKFSRRINRLKTQIYGYRPYPSYRGSINAKFEAYGHAKFGICYENTRDLTNYITEKIFDCMMEGCIPVYWGANNVLDFIPKDCFIDRRDFANTTVLHDFLNSIDETAYAQYQFNMAHFLASSQVKPFKAETFVSRIINVISQDLESL